MFDRLFDPGVLAVIFIFGTPVFAVIGHFMHQIAKAKSDNELKRAMIEKGMSADEIERVLVASSDPKKKKGA